MALRLFDRTCNLTLQRVRPTATEQKFFLPVPDGTVISRLRVQFTVEKNLASKPNTCDVRVTNMSPRSRAELQQGLVVARLDAGYDGVTRRMFAGDVTYSRSTIKGPDWETYIQIGDGARAHAHARANRSYKSGTTVIAVLRDVAASVGLALPKEIATSAELQAQFAAGYAMSGPSRDELTRLLAPFGYSWSVQDGKLRILRDEGFSEDQALVISEANGMIGSPEFGKPDKSGKAPLTVKMFLYPEVNPGGKVSLDTRVVSGIFRVERVRHSGDTHGDEWTTEIEVKPA